MLYSTGPLCAYVLFLRAPCLARSDSESGGVHYPPPLYQLPSRPYRLGHHQAHQHLPGGLEATRRPAGLGQDGLALGSTGGGQCPEETEGPRTGVCPVGSIWSQQFPGACWSLLNGVPPIKAGFVSHVCCSSEPVAILLSGKARLLSGHWVWRMGREQLACSEQTVAPQEAPTSSSQLTPTGTHKETGRLGSVCPPPDACVSPGCLPSLEGENGDQMGQRKTTRTE